ncbi:ATP-binding cassette domain-containing protein [Candidatus Desantisbacteria bacterium]|nr:ATP-binding cassette domain-containing protein [Candidatus Desantisbacteria bacterium]
MKFIKEFMTSIIKPVIQLKDIRKSYKEKENKLILNGIDLSIFSGDFIVIRGESGSGKTTLLRILGLIDKEYQGYYSLADVDIHSGKNSLSWIIQEEIRAKSIGFIFQEALLFEHFTIKENIYLPMRIHGIKSDEAKQDFYSLIKSMYTSGALNEQNSKAADENIKDLLSRYPHNISGGEKQRFSILRSLAHNPVFMLADEPTASLDKDRKKDIFNMLMKLSESGKTIIVVSHDEVFLDAPIVYELQNGMLKLVKSHRQAEKNVDDKAEEAPSSIFSPVSQFGVKILSKKNIWFGLKPRTGSFLQLKLVMNDLIRNILFTILTVGALLLGSFQLTVLESLRSGTDTLLDDVIRRGSRLTRIDIVPKDLSANQLFPDKSLILKIPGVINFIERREGIYRIKDWHNRIRKETMYGLEINDPELDQLAFTAGGKFTSDSALEIIISERSIKRLFKIDGEIVTDEFRNNLIGKKLSFAVARPIRGTTFNTDPDEMEFEEFSISLSIAGIVERAEAGRNFYLPLKTQLVLEKWRLDKEGVFSIPYDPDAVSWTVQASEIIKMAQFPYTEKAHVYVSNVQQVIPVVKKLSSLGYEPRAKIFDYKWVLDTRKLAEWFLKGIVFVVAVIGGLIIFGNIQTSVRMRKNDIILFKLLGVSSGETKSCGGF